MLPYSPSPSFHHAAAYLSSASSLSSVSSTTKLELYGLFKFVTVSPTPSTSRPSIFDMTGRAKWDAWNNTAKKYSRPEDAEQQYIEIAKRLGWTEGTSTVKQADEDAIDLDALDDQPDQPSHKPSGGSGGLGPSVSIVQAPTTMQDGSIHGLAVENDVAGLATILKTVPEIDLDAPDEYGYTPLHLAADRGNVGIVKLLLENGADRQVKDSDDLTALELARIAGHKEIEALLMSPV
ncbi:hypothetical protein AMATHDRAFT_144280 [Amanita thiersii Skay4041]|uniref:ACB domain-containing protein n=1 Tax=Amanita thiersii Skay4041 TaxID=703135 RepID=A0A2A9NN86_9AGAR|nr:hypothetical protein AMATHDRAFT_144280 [Amanita thiersii Skay4041]